MKKIAGWLKKYFVPHEHNQHKPHFLRWETVLVVLGAILFVELFFLVQIFLIFPKTNFFAAILPDVLVDLTNNNRAANDFPFLKINPLLQKAAQLKAEDMAQKGYFAHNSPEGLTPWFWFQKANYNYNYAGENLAINFFDSEDVVAAWMQSSLHRANILNDRFTELGIGTARGLYNGREAVFVVQMFGRPALARAVASEEKTEEKIAESENTYETSSSVITANAIPAYSSLGKRIFTTPRATTNYFYIVLFTIVALALALKIFVKIKIQHPPLIANGLLLLLIISSVLWLNRYLSFTFAEAKVI